MSAPAGPHLSGSYRSPTATREVKKQFLHSLLPGFFKVVKVPITESPTQFKEAIDLAYATEIESLLHQK